MSTKRKSPFPDLAEINPLFVIPDVNNISEPELFLSLAMYQVGDAHVSVSMPIAERLESDLEVKREFLSQAAALVRTGAKFDGFRLQEDLDSGLYRNCAAMCAIRSLVAKRRRAQRRGAKS